MTLTDLALEALAYIFASGAPAPSTNLATIANATAPQKRRLAADLTATMQEIYEMAPFLYRRRMGVILAAPATADVGVTDGSTTITTDYPFVEGSTLLLGGLQNQVFTESGVKMLIYPYSGPTGTVGGTFYNDSIPLVGVAVVLGDVALADGRPLSKRDNRQDFNTVTRGNCDYGRTQRIDINKKLAGIPASYWVEPMLLSGPSSSLRLRVNPMPNQACTIGYDAQMAAPAFTVGDIGTDNVPSTKSLVVESNYVENLVRPIFLDKWANSPWFRDDRAAKRLATDAVAARGRLANYRPQRQQNRRITAPI